MIRAVIGGQAGSEAKGAVVYHLRHKYDVHVRVGGSNAGHTAYDRGRKWALQSVPVGVFNPDATLVIGAGAVIDPSQLLEEVGMLEVAGHEVLKRLLIDAAAAVITPKLRAAEGFISGQAHKRIGSTGKGVGLARMAKLGRGVSGWPLLDTEATVARVALLGTPLEKCVRDGTGPWLSQHHLNGGSILLEGTQGWALNLNGPDWPFVTSADCGAARLAADCGVPPQAVRCTVVARSYPIRVAGNSGPFPSGETTWDAIGVEPETTTVTKKVRRVGNWDEQQVADAILQNGADSLCYMFLDYLYPEVKGVTSWAGLSPDAELHVDNLEFRLGVPVALVGTGPKTLVDREFKW